MIQNDEEYKVLFKALQNLEIGLMRFKEQRFVITAADSVIIDDYNTLIRFIDRQLRNYLITASPKMTCTVCGKNDILAGGIHICVE